MMNIGRYLVLSILGMSLIANAILAVFVVRGITIKNEYHQEQYQNQSQSQLVTTAFAVQGKLTWEKVDWDAELAKTQGSVVTYLESIPAYSSLYMKRIGKDDYRPVIVPTK